MEKTYCKMCSIHDRLDLFLLLKAEIQAFFDAKTEHNWMVNKCTRNSSLRMYTSQAMRLLMGADFRNVTYPSNKNTLKIITCVCGTYLLLRNELVENFIISSWIFLEQNYLKKRNFHCCKFWKLNDNITIDGQVFCTYA